MSIDTTTSTLIQGVTLQDLRKAMREEIDLALKAHGIGVPQKQGADTKALLTRQEAAKYLRISVPSLRRRVKERYVACVHMGGRVLFRKEDLDACLERNTNGDTSGPRLRLRAAPRTSRRRSDTPTSRTSR